MTTSVVCLPNSAGKEILIDAADLDRVGKGKWTVAKYPYGDYAVKEIKTVRYQLHRLISCAKAGEIVDHVNRNGLDNRRCNLRICTHSLNNANQKVRKNKRTSKFKGVWLHAAGLRRPWRARIKVNGRNICLGLYATDVDAHAAYCAAARQHFGEFARFE